MKAASMSLKSRVVVQHRANIPAEPPEGCTIVLLSKAPPPEGGPIDAIIAPECVPQPVRFGSASEGTVAGRTLRSLNWVSFGPCLAWPEATHAAIVDGDGAVFAYGALASAPGHHRGDEVCFCPSAIELRYH